MRAVGVALGDKSATREAVIRVAGYVLATGANLAGFPVPPGAVEAVLAGGAWISELSAERQRDLARVLNRTADEVEAELAVWVSQSSQTDSADLAHAKASLVEVLPHAIPAPVDLVGTNLNPAEVAALVLERAENARPDIYKDKGAKDPANQLARRFLQQAIERACARLLADAEFIDGLRPVLWRELFERTAAIKEDTGAIRKDTTAIRDTMATREDITGLEARLLAAMEDRLAIARASGITDELLIELARRVSSDISNPQQAFVELENMVELAIHGRWKEREASNLGPFVDEVLDRVSEFTARGELNDAAAAIDAALAREAEEARLLEERRQESRARSLRLLDAGIEQDLLRRDADSAAARIVEKAKIDLPDGASLFDHLLLHQNEWYESGRDKGLNLDLEVAIALARWTVDLASDVDEHGTAQNNLGNALSELGMRETDASRLEQAVAAHRLALDVRTRQRVPLDWAMTQNNLSNSLRSLATRETGTVRLEQAVQSARMALEEATRETVPLQWAATQNNLGLALTDLGTRKASKKMLELATSAFRLALQELTRETAPVHWATTQANLGIALTVLGSQETETVLLEQAATAYRLALEVWTQEHFPLKWATVQNSLGNALRHLGLRESCTERLEEAVTAYRLALEEWTQERVPLDWAMTQNNLGNALSDIGMHESGSKRLEEAVVAYRLALEEQTRERTPHDWAGTQFNLGRTLFQIAEREADTNNLVQAVLAFFSSLEVFTPETDSRLHTAASYHLTHAQGLLSERLRAQ